MEDYISRQGILTTISKYTRRPKFYSCFDQIEQYPAADVRPVIHGTWKEFGEPNENGRYEVWYWKCSNCNKIGLNSYNFCPYCGAEMEKKNG